MELYVLLAEAVSRHASDVHFVAGESPIFRINGELERVGAQPSLSSDDIAGLLLPVLPEALRLGLENGALPKAKAMITVPAEPEYSFHVTAYRADGGIGATINILLGKIPALSDIAGEAMALLEGIANLPRGLVLFTGPIGSGKNTTSATVVDAINRSRGERIFVIGDTNGYLWRSDRSVVTTLVVGRDYDSYESAAEAVFGGADPDVVLFTDLPTPEAALQALRLADTGHLVIATLAADSAAHAIHELAEAFPERRGHVRELLARTLVAVFNQHLIVRASRQGRIPAYESLFVTPEVRDIIRVGASPASLYAVMERGGEGTRTLSSVVDAFVASGEITEEAASQHRPASLAAMGYQ